jgi:hypothetical protein
VVARFLSENPGVGQAAKGHPVLGGAFDIAWSKIEGCPAALAEVFGGLLNGAVAEDALRVLGIVLTDGILHLGAAMPMALPFLIECAADRAVPVRSRLVELLVIAAELSQPVGSGDDPWLVRLAGTDEEHPERAQCREVFIEYAASVHALLQDPTLPAGLLTADDRTSPLTAATTP